MVKGRTFDLLCDLILYTLKHYLGNFKNPRSCTSCDATLNFYYGLTQDLYVRATPSKAKSDILRYFNWRQHFQALFAPLVSKFLNEVTNQALQYESSFNQTYSQFQEMILSQGAGGKQMGLHCTSGLTILTINFSNKPHEDSNDNHGKKFQALSMKLISNGKISLKNMRNNVKNAR